MKLRLIRTMLMSAVSVVTLGTTGAASVTDIGNSVGMGEIHQTGTFSEEADNLLEDMKLIGKYAVTVQNTAEDVQQDVQNNTEQAKPAEELIIAAVDNYVNIRDRASVDGNIVGKLYNYSVGILQDETADGWYHIKSGTVDGYVKAEYVLRGEEAKALAEQVGQRLATVHTTTLKVRMEPSTEAKVLGLVPDGDTLAVSEETDGWVKVATEEGDGYVSTDFVEVYTKNVEAESIQEEQARLAKEAEERRLAQKAAEQEIAKQKAAQAAAATAKTTSTATDTAAKSEQNANTSQNSAENTSSASESESTAVSENQASSDSSLGRQIADYGLQFVGNPYVYGGTSLTNGTDCSGFVMRVYQHFGISLPRTSGEQGQCGSAVAGIGNALPGDLIWYSGHIGIYIGNGQIVHASNAADGIKVSSATCMKILSIRRIV